jgi:hypothetical protein
LQIKDLDTNEVYKMHIPVSDPDNEGIVSGIKGENAKYTTKRVVGSGLVSNFLCVNSRIK